jgi:hypothetical protein
VTKLTPLQATEKASESDRKWFARNPHREYRIRHHIPGEFQVPGEPPDSRYIDPTVWTRWTLIKQLKPGMRVRCGVRVLRGAEPVDADWTIGPLFEQVATGAFYADAMESGGEITKHSASGAAIMGAFLPPMGSETVQ